MTILKNVVDSERMSLTQKKSELENEPRKSEPDSEEKWAREWATKQWAPICRILLFYINPRWWRVISFFYLLVDTQLLCQPISCVAGLQNKSHVSNEIYVK